MIPLQEHEQLILNGQPVGYSETYNNLQLIQWDKPTENSSWGYYASFKIGAEWIDTKETLTVTPKRGMENIDFLNMFMTCFSSGLALDSLAGIYRLEFDKPQIEAPALRSILSPLIIIHFVSVVNRIKTLKRGYIHHQENLKKVKGHIKLLKNDRLNIATRRYDRIYCEFSEYTPDIPENRLLKKALLFSQAMAASISRSQPSVLRLRQMISQALTKFENVGDEVDIRTVRQIRSNKLFNEYSEALRLASTILRHFDYSINKAGNPGNSITPFTLDMSLLYEHYVYGLLYEAYHDRISYQFGGKTGYPDFLYKSDDFKAILDAKYIPKYEATDLDTYVVRQLSGYGRDLQILKHLGYKDIDENSPTPSVPCVIVYPGESHGSSNPFKGKPLRMLCTRHLPKLSMFYKISIPVPTLA